MKKGTKVSWQLTLGTETAPTRGNGVTISDEEDGKVLVAVNDLGFGFQGYHPVIQCTVTWLTVEI